MRPGWDDALDLQNDLRRALHSSEGQRYLDWYIRGQSKGLHYVERQGERKIEERKLDPEVYRLTVEQGVGTVENGDPMWVSEDVAEIVAYASERFEPEPLYPHDLLVPNAFCLLPSPWASVDSQGRLILFRAISWGVVRFTANNPGDQGVAIALWSHADDEDAYTQSEHGFPRRIASCPLVLKHVTALRWGSDMADPVTHTLFKSVQVLWRLMWQTIVSTQPEHVSRPVWRRKSNWRQIKTVQVLTLRRTKSQARSEGSDVEWTHRWPVRGHWRWQYYPASKEHHQIWIDGYVKGPEDKPFVAKQSAIEFIR